LEVGERGTLYLDAWNATVAQDPGGMCQSALGIVHREGLLGCGPSNRPLKEQTLENEIEGQSDLSSESSPQKYHEPLDRWPGLQETMVEREWTGLAKEHEENPKA